MIHKHFIFHGTLRSELPGDEYLYHWMRSVIDAIDMNILFGPEVLYSDTLDNEGYTGFAIIDTSHVAVHTWDATGRIEIDIYTCKEFDPDTVLTYVDLIANYGDYMILDRTTGLRIIEKNS